MAPALGWTDPSGEDGNYPTDIEEYARSPTPHLGAKSIMLSQPYERWLDENVEHAFLQTIQSSGQRETYVTDRAPGLCLWQSFTPLQSTSDNFTVLGTLQIRVHYEFRGARTNGTEAS